MTGHHGGHIGYCDERVGHADLIAQDGSILDKWGFPGDLK